MRIMQTSDKGWADDPGPTQAVDENLRRVYAQSLEKRVPEHLNDLLERLRAKQEQHE